MKTFKQFRSFIKENSANYSPIESMPFDYPPMSDQRYIQYVPNKFYHGTTVTNLKKIFKDGHILTPTNNDYYVTGKWSLTDIAYLTSSFDQAREYGSGGYSNEFLKHKNEKAVIITIKKESLDLDKLFFDRQGGFTVKGWIDLSKEKDGFIQFEYHDKIPIEYFSEIHLNIHENKKVQDIETEPSFIKRNFKKATMWKKIFKNGKFLPNYEKIIL